METTVFLGGSDTASLYNTINYLCWRNDCLAYAGWINYGSYGCFNRIATKVLYQAVDFMVAKLKPRFCELLTSR